VAGDDADANLSGTLKRSANDSAVIPPISQSSAYLDTQAGFLAALVGEELLACVGLAGERVDLVAQTGEHRDREAAGAAAGTGDCDRTVLGPHASLLEPEHRAGRRDARGAERRGILEGETLRDDRHPLGRDTQVLCIPPLCVSLKVQPVTTTWSAAFTRPDGPLSTTTPTASAPPISGKDCTIAARPVAARPSF
jgi:hypothetical protein